MMKLQYHQKTFELLGITPTLSLENLKRISDFEAKHDLMLPASLKEWYSLENHKNILQNAINQLLNHSVIELEEGLDEWNTWQHKKINKKHLYVLLENQAVWYIAVRLIDLDDPPVYLCYNEEGEDWELHASTFSDFVFAIVWDSVVAGENLENFVDCTNEDILRQFLTESKKLGPETFLGNMVFKAPRFVRGLHKNQYKTFLVRNIGIRKIVLEDARGFWVALASVAREKKYILTVEPPPFENTKAFVKDNVEKNYAQYVAVCDDSIIGWADIIPLEHPTMAHVGSLGMGVVAEYRGQGIGSKLLSSVIHHAWESGLKRLELEVFSDNEAAIALYKKHGFVQEGVKRFARAIDGHYQDIIVMAQYRI